MIFIYIDIDGDDLVLKLEGSNLPAVTGTLEQVFPLTSTGVEQNQGEKEKGNKSGYQEDSDSDEFDSSKQGTMLLKNRIGDSIYTIEH